MESLSGRLWSYYETVKSCRQFTRVQSGGDEGADAIYIGLKDDTNARHFPGLNFTDKTMTLGINFAHDRDCRVHVAVNTFAHPDRSNLAQDTYIELESRLNDVVIDRFSEDENAGYPTLCTSCFYVEGNISPNDF